jgi:hypothetical protein
LPSVQSFLRLALLLQEEKNKTLRRICMKKILALVLCAALLAIPAAAADVTANKATITINGVRDDAYGGPIDITAPRLNADDFENAAGAATGKVWTAWDDANLYFYVEVNDRTPNSQDGGSGNDDNIEIFIDWNAGKGEPGEASPEAPFWQIRVWSGNNDEIGGYWREDDPHWNIDAFAASEWFTGPLNGSYSNGYVIEIKVPAPPVATLSERKVIPFDVQVCDNMDGAGGREGQMFIGHAGDGIDDNEKWQTPGYLSGVMTLGGVYVAPAVVEEPEVMGMGGGDPAELPAVISAPAAVAPRTADPIALLAIGSIISAAGVVIARRKK